MKTYRIIEEIKGCPYCGHPASGKRGCCGEVHFETLYAVEVNGEELGYLVDESELNYFKTNFEPVLDNEDELAEVKGEKQLDWNKQESI